MRTLKIERLGERLWAASLWPPGRANLLGHSNTKTTEGYVH